MLCNSQNLHHACLYTPRQFLQSLPKPSPRVKIDYEKAFMSQPLPSLLMDHNFGILSCNWLFLLFVNKTKEMVMGKTLLEILYPNPATKLKNWNTSVHRRGETNTHYWPFRFLFSRQLCVECTRLYASVHVFIFATRVSTHLTSYVHTSLAHYYILGSRSPSQSLTQSNSRTRRLWTALPCGSK